MVKFGYVMVKFGLHKDYPLVTSRRGLRGIMAA